MSKDEKLGTCDVKDTPKPHKRTDRCVNWREQPAQGEPSRFPTDETSATKSYKAGASQPSAGEKSRYTPHKQTCSYWATNVCNSNCAEPSSQPSAGERPHCCQSCYWTHVNQAEGINTSECTCSCHRVEPSSPPATAGTAREWREAHGGKDSWAYWNDDRTEHYAAEQVRQAEDLQRRLQNSKLPCGHLSQYGFTEDGGAHIVCLRCEVAELRQERERDKRNYDHLDFLYTDLKEHTDDLREARERAEKKYATLVAAVGDLDCLDTCDTYGHDEKCPNAIAAEGMIVLQERAERAEGALLDLKGRIELALPLIYAALSENREQLTAIPELERALAALKSSQEEGKL